MTDNPAPSNARNSEGDRHIYTVVLTGGIASGKTTVSNIFRKLGVPVIDTDEIARELVEPGMPALKAILEVFGSDYLDPAGRLDRRKMRSTIFSNSESRARLEATLHPLIRNEVRRRIAELDTPYCIVVIPLFGDSPAYGWVDRVLVVDVNEEAQISRVMERDRITRAEALAILASQTGRSERLAFADDVLSNEETPEELPVRVAALHRKYLELADHAQSL